MKGALGANAKYGGETKGECDFWGVGADFGVKHP
jgi:hypothetical protein